jgi:hemerythrin-like domain-containing protein
MYAIQMIEDEHRSLAAVLHAMLHVVHEIRDSDAAPDFKLFGAMIYYIDTFPERYHHPKESEYLFPLVCTRHPAAAPLIERLDHEHVLGAERVRTLEQTLARYSNGGVSEFGQFLAAVESYADLEWRHMSSEEKELLPLAKQYLTPAIGRRSTRPSPAMPTRSWARRWDRSMTSSSAASSISRLHRWASGSNART